jgi:uncharacterized MAPEG superfamily protein
MSRLEIMIVEWSKAENWRFGFYYSKNDPRSFVAKKSGFGWTPNFANSKSFLLFALFIVAACIPVVIYSNGYVTKIQCAMSEIFVIAVVSCVLNRLSSVEFYLK